MVFGLAVWPGRAVTFGWVSPVVWREVSEGAGSDDLRTGSQRVGSERTMFVPA